MKYHLLFALKLKREESPVIYNPNDFEGNPVAVSYPAITSIISNFVVDFDLLPIVEPNPLKKPTSKKASNSNKTNGETANKIEHSKDGIEQNPSPLGGVAGTAYICKLKNLNKPSLDRLCSEIATYLKDCISEISPDKILSSELASDFAGIREAVELRNYLSNWVEDKRPMYQNGYIYIIPMN